jgi:GTPase
VVDQVRTVDDVLADLGADAKPRVMALNKVDLIGPATLRRTVNELSRRHPSAVPISAENRTGLDRLLEELDEVSRPDLVEVELLLPYGQQALLAELRTIGGLQRTEYEPAGTRAWGWVPRHALPRFERYCADAEGGAHPATT